MHKRNVKSSVEISVVDVGCTAADWLLLARLVDAMHHEMWVRRAWYIFAHCIVYSLHVAYFIHTYIFIWYIINYLFSLFGKRNAFYLRTVFKRWNGWWSECKSGTFHLLLFSGIQALRWNVAVVHSMIVQLRAYYNIRYNGWWYPCASNSPAFHLMMSSYQKRERKSKSSQ